MNNVIQYKICPLLGYKDLENLKEVGIIKEEILEKRKEEILKDVYSMFPKYVVEMVGEDNLLMGDKIEWKHEWLGPTDYIDRISHKDLKNTFSYGVDCFRRSFIFVKVKTEHRTFVISVFQRYTDAGTYVAISPEMYFEYLQANVALNEHYIELLHNLFSEKTEYKLC